MASIFKRKRKVRLDSGKAVVRQSRKYYTRLAGADGIKRTIPLYTDKTASEQRAAQLQKEFELADAGVVDRYREHRQKPLVEHLGDFENSLSAKRNTLKHAKQVASRVRRIVKGCKFVHWPDIQASKVEGFLADLQKSGSISAQTFNHYLKAAKEFTAWMVQDGRASESPLKHLKSRAIKKVVDEVHPRRVLEVDELRLLLETARSGPLRFGMTGLERYLCYRVAAETGLRANELRSLRVASFDLKNHTVEVSAGFTKNRREAIIPLRPDTAAELDQLMSGKMPEVQVFKVPEKAYKMMQADLADAGIPYVVDGLYFDFHALRHQTGTLLAASGVHPRIAQSIMRHSDVNLTLSRYSHTLTGQEAEAVKKMPDLSTSGKKRETATGTNGRGCDTPGDGAEPLTPKWTPKLTPTAFSECDWLSSGVNLISAESERAGGLKRLQEGRLGSKKESLSSGDIDEKGIRLARLERATFGSVDRRSIQLSYRRFTNQPPGI